jgi:DNA-binding CsgD family transcriptional regulator
MELTAIEQKICSMVVAGNKNREIATRLGKTELQVKEMFRSIYQKVNVSDRLELALYLIHNPGVCLLVDSAPLGTLALRELKIREYLSARTPKQTGRFLREASALAHC